MAADNTIDFIIRAKDMMSGVLPKIGSAAQSAFGAMNTQINRYNQQMTVASRSVADMRLQLDRLHRRRDSLINLGDIRSVNREIEQIERRINRLSNGGKSSGGGGMLGSIIGGNLISGGITAAAQMAGRVISDSISASMAYGMQEKSFQVLTRDARRGKELAAELRNLKQTTLVGGGVYGNAQTMLGFGVNDRDVVRKLREIGDVGMGNVDRMQSLSLVRAQVTAAGRLMGQDLLQFINAGFNPLSVMSEKWKDFGFKAKMTIGQLKDMMEQGQISSTMVDKAFTSATSKGGQFYKMMDQIGETAGGQALKMKGNWAAFQIDLGNSLAPLQGEFLKVASSALHMLNISKSVPDALRGEQMEVNTLTQSIVKLNQGNEMRGRMLDMLKGKYPDLYGAIDTEKVKNEELLTILKKVNGEYETRIKYAATQQRAEKARERAGELIQLAVSATNQAQEAQRSGYYKNGPLGLFDRRAFAYLSATDRLKMEGTGIPYDETPKGLMSFARQAQLQAQRLQGDASTANAGLKDQELVAMIVRANEIAKDKKLQKELWGNDAGKNLSILQRESGIWNQMRAKGGGTVSAAMRGYDWGKLQSVINPSLGSGDGAGGSADAITNIGKTITGGGQKVVNIRFNNIVETMNNNVAGGQTAVQGIEQELEQAINRIFQRVN